MTRPKLPAAPPTPTRRPATDPSDAHGPRRSHPGSVRAAGRYHRLLHWLPYVAPGGVVEFGSGHHDRQRVGQGARQPLLARVHRHRHRRRHRGRGGRRRRSARVRPTRRHAGSADLTTNSAARCSPGVRAGPSARLASSSRTGICLIVFHLLADGTTIDARGSRSLRTAVPAS